MDFAFFQKMLDLYAHAGADVLRREAAIADLLSILVDNSAKSMQAAADVRKSETAAEDAATLRRTAEIYREQATLLRAALEAPEAALDRARDVVAQHRRAGLTVVRDAPAIEPLPIPPIASDGFERRGVRRVGGLEDEQIDLAGEGDPGAGARSIGSGAQGGRVTTLDPQTIVKAKVREYTERAWTMSDRMVHAWLAGALRRLPTPRELDSGLTAYAAETGQVPP